MASSPSKLVLVGEAPGGEGPEARPALEGLAGNTLCRYMDVAWQVYLDNTVRVNLFEVPDEGKVWLPLEARLRAMRLAGGFGHGDRVILLGARVAAAFGVVGVPLFQWTSMQRVMTGETWWVARIHHPSGRNRKLNDRAERESMRKFLHEAIRDRA